MKVDVNESMLEWLLLQARAGLHRMLYDLDSFTTPPSAGGIYVKNVC